MQTCAFDTSNAHDKHEFASLPLPLITNDTSNSLPDPTQHNTTRIEAQRDPKGAFEKLKTNEAAAIPAIQLTTV